ncbi:MAG: hypothetical protein ACT4PT_13165 [Methanobacteriota archaeon]
MFLLLVGLSIVAFAPGASAHPFGPSSFCRPGDGGTQDVSLWPEEWLQDPLNLQHGYVNQIGRFQCNYSN